MKKYLRAMLIVMALTGAVQTIVISLILWQSLEGGKNVRDREIIERSPEGQSESQSVIESAPAAFVDNMVYPPAGEFTLSMRQMYPEWDPVEYVAVSMPLQDILSDINKLQLYMDIFKAIAPEVEMLVFIERGDPGRLSYLMHFLEGPAGCKELLDRITFVESTAALRWIRDFGPLYGQSERGSLVLFDSLYRSSLYSKDQALGDIEDRSRAGKMAYLDTMSDQLPLYLNAYLTDKKHTAVQLLKTGLVLDGGDVFFDADKAMFTSLDTLIRNEVDKDTLTLKFRNMFGVERVHYLKALPGESVDHLDMLFKPLRNRKAFVPDIKEYEANVNVGPVYRRHLIKQIIRVVNDNHTYLSKNCPDMELVKIPMPLPIFAGRDKMIYDSYFTVLRNLSLKLLNKRIPQLTNADESDFRQILTYLESDTGPLDKDPELRLDKILRRYLNTDLESYLNVYAEAETAYRSYINYFMFSTVSGSHFAVIPRYTGKTAEENLKLAVMEKEVENRFREVDKNVIIKWIDSDVLTADQSALHCILAGVPAH